MDFYRAQVLCCGGTGCTSSGSGESIKRFEEQIVKNGLDKEVKVVRTGCFGLCAAGPVVIVYPEGTFYSHVRVEDVDEIVTEHLLKGRVVTRLLYQETVSPTGGIKALIDTDFYKKQHRIALRNCGVINPENIDEYIAFDGYRALGKALTEMTPAEAAEVDYEAPMEDAEETAPEQPAQPARKTCPQCGAPVSDDALFCNKCGAQL